MLILVVGFDTKIQPKSCKLEITQIGLFVAFGVFCLVCTYCINILLYTYNCIHIRI